MPSTTRNRKSRNTYRKPLIVGSYVDFRKDHEYYRNDLGADARIMTVHDVDHYTDSATVEYSSVNTMDNATTLAYATVPMGALCHAEIEYPDDYMPHTGNTREWDEETMRLKQESRMERRAARDIFNAILTLYMYNTASISYQELSTAMFNVTVHGTVADDLAQYTGPTCAALMFAYERIPAYIRIELFMSHMRELRIAAGLI